MIILVYLLLLCQTTVFSQQWKPDISTLNGQIRVVGAILKKHPDFIKQNIRFKNNPLHILKPTDELVKQLGDNASDLTFGTIARISSIYSDDGELLYDQEKVSLLKAELQAAAKRLVGRVQSLELKGLQTDALELLNIDHKYVRDYLMLMPFIYSSSGKPEIILISNNTIGVLLEKISATTADELHRYYTNLIKYHLEILSDLDNPKLEAELNSLKNKELSDRNKVLKNAITPVSKGGTVLKRRMISLEEVPALVGLFRGNFGWDCATTEVPYYALVKGAKTYLLRKSLDYSEASVGYAFVVPTKINGKTIPYIITIAGETLTNIDVKEVTYLVGKIWNSKNVVLGDGGATSFAVREKVFKNTQNLTQIELPAGWETVDAFSPNFKYNKKILSTGKLVELYRTPKGEVEYVKTTYKKPRNIEDFSIKDRATIGVYCLDDYKSDKSIIMMALGITSDQLDIATGIISASPEDPITAPQFREAQEIGYEFKDLLHLDLLTKVYSLLNLYRESPQITDPREWGRVFSNINMKLNSEIEKANDIAKIKVLIKAKLSTPQKYWINDIITGVTETYEPETVVEILKALSIKFSKCPLRLWDVMPYLMENNNKKIKNAAILYLSKLNELDTIVLSPIIEWLESGNDEEIEQALEIIKGKSALVTGIWEALADLILNGSPSIKDKLPAVVNSIKERHRDFWERQPELLETYEGACILANTEIWPDYFWAVVPELMKSPNDKVRLHILLALSGKNSVPKGVEDLIPSMTNDVDSDVKNAADFLVQSKGRTTIDDPALTTSDKKDDVPLTDATTGNNAKTHDPSTKQTTRGKNINDFIDDKLGKEPTPNSTYFLGTDGAEINISIFKDRPLIWIKPANGTIDLNKVILPDVVKNSIVNEVKKGKQLTELMNNDNVVDNGRFFKTYDPLATENVFSGEWICLTTLSGNEQYELEQILFDTLPIDKRERLFDDSDIAKAYSDFSFMKETRSRLQGYVGLTDVSDSYILIKALEKAEYGLEKRSGKDYVMAVSMLFKDSDVMKFMKRVSNYSYNKNLYEDKLFTVVDIIDKASKQIKMTSGEGSPLVDDLIKDLKEFREFKELKTSIMK
ncbi:MAG: hypothetical protein WCQ53_03600 [bacterium]